MSLFVLFLVNLLFCDASLLEGGQTLLHCPDGQYVGFTHGRYFYNSCGADVTRTLNINCCNHQSCLIKATNDWLGVDPCVGDTKTLEWTMICRDVPGLCSSEPCGNGTCSNQCVSYSCSCFPGFSGQNCEIDLNECASSPCINGTCLDAINNFVCLCDSGFTGILCDQDIDECSSSPCIHGTCQDAVNHFKCWCEVGYTGIQCEQDIDDCSEGPCIHGACQDQVHGYICHCDLFHVGETCHLINIVIIAVITVSICLALTTFAIAIIFKSRGKRYHQQENDSILHFEDVPLGQAKKRYFHLMRS